MREKRKTPGHFSKDVATQSTAFNLHSDKADVEPPIDYEGADSAVIRIVLADSQTIYRVGIQKIFALENDIRVIDQAESLAGLHRAIQCLPTDVILLEGKLIAGTVDAVPELLGCTPKGKIIILSSRDDETNTVELYHRGVRGIIPRSISPDLLVKCVRTIAAACWMVRGAASERITASTGSPHCRWSQSSSRSPIPSRRIRRHGVPALGDNHPIQNEGFLQP